MATTLARWNVGEAFLPSANKPGAEIVSGTNFPYRVLHFDQTTDESCYFLGQLPENYGAAANIEVDVRWLTDVSTTGTVRWAAQVLGRTNGETWDVALSSETTVDDARSAASALHVATIAIAAPALAPSDEFVLRILRKGGVGGYAADADLRGVVLKAA